MKTHSPNWSAAWYSDHRLGTYFREYLIILVEHNISI